MLSPRIKHDIMVTATTEVSEISMSSACSDASLKRLASLKTGNIHVMFVLASNTKVVARRLRAPLNYSNFEGM